MSIYFYLRMNLVAHYQSMYLNQDYKDITNANQSRIKVLKRIILAQELRFDNCLCCFFQPLQKPWPSSFAFLCIFSFSKWRLSATYYIALWVKIRSSWSNKTAGSRYWANWWMDDVVCSKGGDGVIFFSFDSSSINVICNSGGY